jgi:hypothetical protein
MDGSESFQYSDRAIKDRLTSSVGNQYVGMNK